MRNRTSVSATTGAGEHGPRPQLPWPESLLQRMEPQPNGCIYYTGALDYGYGQIRVNDRTKRAHRAAYELFIGPIPDGMTLDHECHNRDLSCPGGVPCLHRRCVNVDHLAVKSRGENVLASPNTPQSINARKTHCPSGHPYDEANTHITKEGKRHCRTCDRERHAAASGR